MVKVVKFGGSSLASADQFRKVKDIIKADPDRRFVVPSAPGKRHSADTKVTDMLYSCYALAEQDADFDDALSAIKKRYVEIIDGLGMNLSLDKEFDTLRADFKAHTSSSRRTEPSVPKRRMPLFPRSFAT